MAKRKRLHHAPSFKAQVVMAALKGDKTLAELAQHFDVHPPPDYRLEELVAGTRRARIWRAGWILDTGTGFENAARQDGEAVQDNPPLQHNLAA